MEKSDKKITARTYFVALVILLMIVVIAIKLIKIQIEEEEYRAKIDETKIGRAHV